MILNLALMVAMQCPLTATAKLSQITISDTVTLPMADIEVYNNTGTAYVVDGFNVGGIYEATPDEVSLEDKTVAANSQQNFGFDVDASKWDQNAPSAIECHPVGR